MGVDAATCIDEFDEVTPADAGSVIEVDVVVVVVVVVVIDDAGIVVIRVRVNCCPPVAIAVVVEGDVWTTPAFRICRLPFTFVLIILFKCEFTFKL